MVLGCASISRPSSRPMGTNMSTVSLKMPNVMPSPTPSANAVVRKSGLATPPQKTKSCNMPRNSLVWANPRRTNGIAKHARRKVSGISVCRKSIVLVDVRLPRPRPRKHAIKMLFCRYAKIRTSVPIHRISSISRNKPSTLIRKMLSVVGRDTGRGPGGLLSVARRVSLICSKSRVA